MLEELLNQYSEKFDENFPIFLFAGRPEEEVISIITEALKTNKAVITEYQEENDY